MYIKINKDKVRVGAPILAGENVIISIDSVDLLIFTRETKNYDSEGTYIDSTFTEVKTIAVNTKVYAESDTLLERPLTLYELNNKYLFEITTEDNNTLIAARKVVEKLKEVYSLTDSDITIKSELFWRSPERLIRLYIPFKIVISTYNDLISGIKQVAPYFELKDGYVVYLEEIYEQHRAILENDPNVLIEE